MIEFWLNDPWLIAEQNQQAKARFRALLEAYPLSLQDFPVKILDDGHAIDRLSEIAVPVLVMVGEWDIADNHAHAGVIQAGVKNTERIVVSDAGHLIYMEQPQVFNRRVMEFLEREGLHRAA